MPTRIGPAATIIGVRTTPDRFTIPSVQINAQKIGTNTTGIANQFLWKNNIIAITIPKEIGNIVSKSS